MFGIVLTNPPVSGRYIGEYDETSNPGWITMSRARLCPNPGAGKSFADLALSGPVADTVLTPSGPIPLSVPLASVNAVYASNPALWP